MPVLPFTYNKKYTIQPQDFFFTCVNTRGGAVLGNTDSKRKTVADFFFFPSKNFCCQLQKRIPGKHTVGQKATQKLSC